MILQEDREVGDREWQSWSGINETMSMRSNQEGGGASGKDLGGWQEEQ
jgi:hypothetical protein